MAELLIVTRVTRPPPGVRLFGQDDRLLQRYEMEGLASIYWPAEQVQNAVNISYCESGFHTGAWAIEREDSRGLWQLNIEAHVTYGQYNLFDPMINAYFAHELWSSQGWQPWTCASKLGIT